MTIDDPPGLKQAIIEREKQILPGKVRRDSRSVVAKGYARNDKVRVFPGRLEMVEQIAKIGFE